MHPYPSETGQVHARTLSYRAVPLFGGLIGFVAFVSSLGLVLTNPTNYEWVLHGDWAIHFLGWHMYRHSPWTFPLGASPFLGWPIGSSVGLTDSIPIFAGPFKVLGPFLPAYFQYIGLWLLTCFVLQGVFGALLMRVVTSRLSLQLLGTTLFVMSPPLLFRVGHPALTAHWLFLAGLWLYFRRGGDTPSRATLVGWAAVVGIAAATHPYMTLMVLALTGAAYARQLIVQPSHAVRIIGHLVAIVTIAGFVLWQSGYFIVGGTGDLQVGGFGFHSMNLLALFNPMFQGSTLFGPGRIESATPGQYEGYAYMGAGLLFLMTAAAPLIVVAIIRARGSRWTLLQHLPLVMACVFLTLLALSPMVTMGSRILFAYDESWWGPLRVFRASGRVFWPVFYTLAAGVIALAARVRYRYALVLLAIAVGLQAADTRGSYLGMRQTRTIGFLDPLQNRFWREVPRHYQHLTLIPTNMCEAVGYVDYKPFSLLAGRDGLTLNAGMAARYDVQRVRGYCESFSEGLRSWTAASDTLYIVREDWLSRFRAAAKEPVVCTVVDHHGVCSAPATYFKWQDSFDILRAALPSHEDFSKFFGELNEEYRHRLHRPARPTAASPDDRLRALARYLSYRVGGCGHREANDKTLREVRGEQELRFCAGGSSIRALPPPNETLEFWHQLDAAYGERQAGDNWVTYVDPEGEAVWMQAYVHERLNRRDDDDARLAVLNAIRSLTGSGTH